MNEPTPFQAELQQLCDAAVEETLTPEQMRRLEELVLSDPTARRYYVEYLHQHGCLHWSPLAKDEPKTRQSGGDVLPATLGIRPFIRRRRVLISALAAACVLLGVGLWFNQRSSAPTVATLTGGKSCKWDAGSLPTEEGAQLSAGRLRLAEGIARLTFANGAEITLEAPAELELVSSQRCVLHNGRLIAKVPPQAIGFVVDTPTAVLKDLGTEFGVNVRDAQTSDVQVFNGIVDVKHRASGQVERLLTGRNRRFGSDTAADFDPQAEKPLGGTGPTVGIGARIIQLSTAMARGRDTYVQPLYPSPNSSDILLLVKSTRDERSDYNRKAYIGMDLAPVAGMRVIDAQLTLTYTPTGMGFASEVPNATFVVYGLTDETLDDWEERGLRWNNAPANQPGGSSLDPNKVVLLGKFEIVQGALEGTRSISGPALTEFLNRDTNGLATFIVVRETRGSGRSDLVHGFASKQHPRLPPPTLKVTVAPRSK
ncbi:MAG: DNRLRE domain-containing protein [Gemmataceae bacterium]|nr:DNRLRE domain-containing protein [Gemmataceae bacterium]